MAKTDINWENKENYTLLNPRMPENIQTQLQETAHKMAKEKNLDSHIFLTSSGSTSAAPDQIKVVAIAKHAFLNSAQRVNRHFDIDKEDHLLLSLPLFHVGGLAVSARAYVSASQVTEIPWGHWDVQQFYKTLVDNRITVVSLVPTQIHDLVQNKLSAPEQLRMVLVGGGALSDVLLEKALDLGWNCRATYGMTETASMVAEVKNNVLYPFASVNLKSNSENILQIRCPSLLTCYAQKSKNESLEILTPVDSEGWLLTDDRVVFQSRGYSLLGRTKEFVKISGEGVYLPVLRGHLEDILLAELPSYLHQFVLFAEESPRSGHEINLITTADTNISDKVIHAFNAKVLPYEKVRKVYRIPRIPKTELGKIMWNEVRQMIHNQDKS